MLIYSDYIGKWKSIIVHQSVRFGTMLQKEELYQLINNIIQKNKEDKRLKKQRGSSNLKDIKNYYSDFLNKRKLIPKSKNCKFYDIKKFFQQFDSYVDLNDVVVAICEHINVENDQIDVQEELRENRKIMKKKALETSTSDCEKVLEKAQRLIRDSYKDGRYFQLNNCREVVNNLEKNSKEINNVKYKNSANCMTYHQLTNRKFSQGRKYFRPTRIFKPNTEKLLLESQTLPVNSSIQYEQKDSPWKMLQERQKRFKLIQNLLETEDASDLPAGIFDMTELNENKAIRKKLDVSKLLNSAVVYLHMILERQHFKKWRVDKKERTSRGSSNEKSSQYNEKQSQEGKKLSWKINVAKSEKFRKSRRMDTSNSTDSGRTTNQQQVTIKDMHSVGNTLSVKKGIMKYPSSKKYLTGSIKTESNLEDEKSVIFKKSLKRPSICQPIEAINQSDELSDFYETKSQSEINIIKKRLRHTLMNPHEIELTEDKRITERELLEQKSKENREIRRKFTFKKRKVKEGVIRKINEFVNDVQHVERTMTIDRKHCEKELNRIQDHMEYEFPTYHTQKFLSDDQTLQGVRFVLFKQESHLKRLFQNNSKK